jgi:hypothetical protein
MFWDEGEGRVEIEMLGSLALTLMLLTWRIW